jgi:serine/threonine-protein kinase
MKRTTAACGALMLALFTPHPAAAGDPALAESLFRQARESMRAGDYSAACPKLEESFAQDAATGTLLALALCQEQAGKTASAWATYGTVVARSAREGQADREAVAKERRQALEGRLSRLTIEVPAEVRALPGLEIRTNGNPVGEGAWGTPAPVDPGPHQVEVSAPDKAPWSTSIQVGEGGDAVTLVVPPLTDAPPAGVAAAPSAPADAPPPPQAAKDEAPAAVRPLNTVALAMAGAGVIGLGVSGYYGLRASSLNEDSKRGDRCDESNDCDTEGLALREDAVDAATVATVFLVTGGVLTAAGVTLYVLGDSTGSGEPHAVVTPSITSSSAGLYMTGQF